MGKPQIASMNCNVITFCSHCIKAKLPTQSDHGQLSYLCWLVAGVTPNVHVADVVLSLSCIIANNAIHCFEQF